MTQNLRRICGVVQLSNRLCMRGYHGLSVLVVGLYLLTATCTLPTYAAPPTVTLTMRLADAEWQVLRQHILPPFEASCGCQVKAIDVPPETLVQRLRAMHRAKRMQIDIFAQDNMRLRELVEAGLVSQLPTTEAQMDDSIYPALTQAGLVDSSDNWRAHHQIKTRLTHVGNVTQGRFQ